MGIFTSISKPWMIGKERQFILEDFFAQFIAVFDNIFRLSVFFQKKKDFVFS